MYLCEFHHIAMPFNVIDISLNGYLGLTFHQVETKMQHKNLA